MALASCHDDLEHVLARVTRVRGLYFDGPQPVGRDRRYKEGDRRYEEKRQ